MIRTNTYSFNTRRTRCPECSRKRSFAAIKGMPEFGKCFGCGVMIPPDRTPKQSADHTLNGPNEERSVGEDEVQRTFDWSNLHPMTKRECTDIDERAAIMEFDGHLTRQEADELSGYNRRYRIIDELTALRHLNPFLSTIIELTRPSILADWNIGSIYPNCTLFWYRDFRGRFVNAKKVTFGSDGFHRDKQEPTGFLYGASDGFTTCLYGEHQLHPGFRNYLGSVYSNKTPIILVESEKTAIIMSHHKPEFIWMASSGSNGMTAKKSRILRGRSVKLLYDCDKAGEEGAMRACRVLAVAGAKPEKLDQFKLTQNPPDGLDIADLVFQEFSQLRNTL